MIASPHNVGLACQTPVTRCVCCGTSIYTREGCCAECQTPVDVSLAVSSRETPQHFISVLGASGVGKTVYLGLLLDMLTGGSNSLRGLATNAFSVALQEQVVTALERRTFPEKTPAEADVWKWVHCELSITEKKKTRHLDLVAPDFAGEAIAMEVNQSGLYPAIREVVTRSKGLLILCDSLKVRDGGPAEDLFAMKLASYIADAQGRGKDSTRKRKELDIAIAVVFTKCDGCAEARENPQAFAANNMPRLLEFCRQTFGHHAFFSASVVGSAGILADDTGRHMQVPFHIEPHGISEPLEWILQHC